MLIFLSKKSCLLIRSAAYFQMQTNFITEANTMNPDQTAPYGSNKMPDLIWIQKVWHSEDTLKEFFEKDDFEKNQQTTKKNEKLLSMQRVKHTNCKVNLRLIVGDWTYANLIVNAKSLLHWPAILYQMPLEWQMVA